MKMNKKEFINNLMIELGYNEEKSTIINDVLENNFFLSKSKKDAIVEELQHRLEVDYQEALNVYNTAISIIKDKIKDQLKHPFKGKE